MTSHVIKMLAMSILAALLSVGCDPVRPKGDEASGAGMPGMPGMSNAKQSEQRPEHMAEGTLNSVDQAAGRVNITHGPIASANWPGMTMTFKLANPSDATDLKPGQHVEFHFTIESGMDATVTEIKAMD